MVPKIEGFDEKYKQNVRDIVSNYVNTVMDSLGITNSETAIETYRAMGVSPSTARSYIGQIRDCGIGLETGDTQHLERLSILLHHLKFSKGSRVVKKLKDLFPNHFYYPPKKQ